MCQLCHSVPSAKTVPTGAFSDGAAAEVTGGAEALVVARVGAARARGRGVAAGSGSGGLRGRRHHHHGRARAQVPAGGRGLVQVLSGREVCE